jgi:hypothetical protein
MNAWIVSLYERGKRRSGDCLPKFYPTREAAARAGAAELWRAAKARLHGDYLTGWPVRFTVRRTRLSLGES